MADSSIFGTVTTPIALSLDKTLITINGTDNDNDKSYKLAVNQMSWSFTRQMTPYYTLSGQRIIISGEPVGQLTLQYIMGASSNIKGFIEQFSDVCKISENSISVTVGNSATCSGSKFNGTDEKYVFKNCLLSQIGGQITRSQNGNLCIGSAVLTFTAMELTDK